MVEEQKKAMQCHAQCQVTLSQCQVTPSNNNYMHVQLCDHLRVKYMANLCSSLLLEDPSKCQMSCGR